MKCTAFGINMNVDPEWLRSSRRYQSSDNVRSLCFKSMIPQLKKVVHGFDLSLPGAFGETLVLRRRGSGFTDPSIWVDLVSSTRRVSGGILKRGSTISSNDWMVLSWSDPVDSACYFYEWSFIGSESKAILLRKVGEVLPIYNAPSTSGWIICWKIEST